MICLRMYALVIFFLCMILIYYINGGSAHFVNNLTIKMNLFICVLQILNSIRRLTMADKGERGGKANTDIGGRRGEGG